MKGIVMSEDRFPSVSNLVSYDGDPNEIVKRHQSNLAYFGATAEDCELFDLRPAPAWDRAKSHFRLRIKTYKGWRVYMLHTGCIASIPEYEKAA
jgi:hypothetical protein